jgi:hypothetical protein
VSVYVVDVDGPADHKFNDRDRAAGEPTCFVAINLRAFEGRFLTENWLCRVSLADLVAGRIDFAKALAALAGASLPQSTTKATIPVYAKGHVLIQPVEKPHPERVFFVELAEDTVRVNGQIVVNPQAGQRLKVFRILWKQFVTDLADGRSPDQFHAINMRRLLKRMEEEGQHYDDETALRRVVNNLQSDIETVMKRKIGPPIGREDIVETCRMTSQADTDGGYRINPFSVALRPARPR